MKNNKPINRIFHIFDLKPIILQIIKNFQTITKATF